MKTTSGNYKLEPYQPKSDYVYHGTSAANIDAILKDGLKKGSQLPEDAFRSGGYGQIQDSVSFSTDPRIAAIFTGASPRGVVFECRLKPNSKVVKIEGIEYAEDLNELIPELKANGIDAVYLEAEKEIAVIDPKTVRLTGGRQEFKVIERTETNFDFKRPTAKKK